ncbi:hypothetical protein [Actinokineospora sp.]|uniref:hypothetical protein n=1 Tax=Actinokineospora sp. TaxID=1872133 RepID=UPI003D6A81D7
MDGDSQRAPSPTLASDNDETNANSASLTLEFVAHIDKIIDRAHPAQTKALIDGRVAEVKITGPNQVIPIFRIPQPRAAADDHAQGARESDDEPKDPVCTMVKMVGRVGLEPTAKGL